MAQIIRFACILLTLTTAAAAETTTKTATETIYTWQTAFGQCTGSNYFSCSWQLKRQAESDAYTDLDLRCRVRQGKLQTGGFYCGTPSCIPSHMNHNDQSTSVQCRIDCQARCEF